MLYSSLVVRAAHESSEIVLVDAKPIVTRAVRLDVLLETKPVSQEQICVPFGSVRDVQELAGFKIAKRLHRDLPVSVEAVGRNVRHLARSFVIGKVHSGSHEDAAKVHSSKHVSPWIIRNRVRRLKRTRHDNRIRPTKLPRRDFIAPGARWHSTGRVSIRHLGHNLTIRKLNRALDSVTLENQPTYVGVAPRLVPVRRFAFAVSE